MKEKKRLSGNLFGILLKSTIFMSAFLLFQIEPMVGKYLLPRFGGGFGVWSVCLFFFSATLLLGYLYSHLLLKLEIKQQRLIQVFVLLTILIICSIQAISWSAPLLSNHIDSFNLVSTPRLRLILSLFVCVGLPFFCLSTTSTLIQDWYGKSKKNENPYSLYSISNLASFIALISYPIFIESIFSLKTQAWIWFALYVVYSFLMILITKNLQPYSKKPILEKVQNQLSSPIITTSWPIWLLLSFIPSLVLTSFTTEITQNIAPIPLLWVATLSLYLLSFVVGFSKKSLSLIWLGLFVVVSSGLLYFFSFHITFGFDNLMKGLACMAVLFCSGLVFHRRLYEVAPSKDRLSQYYLFIALGGVLGNLAGGIVSPMVFNDIWEFQLSLLFIVTVTGWIIAQKAEEIYGFKVKRSLLFAALLIISCVFSYQWYRHDKERDGVMRKRNFYGVLAVYDGYDTDDTPTRWFVNGKIIHGAQYIDVPNNTEPTTYFSVNSGVAQVINYYQIKSGQMHVGVFGLGVGTLSSYCRENDIYDFYEIDQDVVGISSRYFSYLANCQNLNLKLGDARLTFENEGGRSGERTNLDLLIIDTFSGDTIPVHLLTKEAVDQYLLRLKPNGAIAFHTSNWFFNLPPIIAKIALAKGFDVVRVFSSGDSYHIKDSEWIIVSKNQGLINYLWGLNPEVFTVTDVPVSSGKMWTDYYSNPSAIFKPELFSGIGKLNLNSSN